MPRSEAAKARRAKNRREDDRPRCPYCLREANAESRRTQDRGYIVGRPDRVSMTPLLRELA